MMSLDLKGKAKWDAWNKNKGNNAEACCGKEKN